MLMLLYYNCLQSARESRRLHVRFFSRLFLICVYFRTRRSPHGERGLKCGRYHGTDGRMGASRILNDPIFRRPSKRRQTDGGMNCRRPIMFANSVLISIRYTTPATGLLHSTHQMRSTSGEPLRSLPSGAPSSTALSGTP